MQERPISDEQTEDKQACAPANESRTETGVFRCGYVTRRRFFRVHSISSLTFHDCGRSPGSVEDGVLRPVCPDVKGEVAFRRGEPVRHLVLARRCGGNIDGE